MMTGSSGTSGSLARNQFSIMQSFDLRCGREWDVISRTGSMASAAHLAYHLGAIRQLVAIVAAG